MKCAAINKNTMQIPNGSLGADPRSLENVLRYFSADLDTEAVGSDVNIKDFISGSTIAGGDGGDRGASINETGGPNGKRAYDFSTGVYNLGNFNSNTTNFAFTIVSKVTDKESSGEGTIAFKNPTRLGFGGDFNIKYRVNIPTPGDDINARVVSTLNAIPDLNEPENATVQSMLKSYHVMTVVQANEKMTLRFNGQQHRQVTNSGLTTNMDFLLGDSDPDGSSAAGKFITPEFVIYTLNDTTNFSDVINMERYLQKKYGLTFKPIS